jgi:type IV secretion system protein VirB3
LLVGVPVHGFLYLLSASDPNRFAAIWVWLQTGGRCLNTKFWGGASFSPLSFKKWQD